MKWAEMTPEQRDALVAEKVMGWVPGTCDGSMGEQPCSPDGWFCQTCGHEGSWGDDFEHEQIPPHYTTSMDAAWQVVEKMVERMDKPEEEFEWYGPIRHKGNYGRGIFESHSFDYTKKGGFNSLPCWYVRYAQDMRYAWILADTPQEAICLAGLHVVGCEVWQ